MALFKKEQRAIVLSDAKSNAFLVYHKKIIMQGKFEERLGPSKAE